MDTSKATLNNEYFVQVRCKLTIYLLLDVRSALQAWPIESTQDFHVFSNSHLVVVILGWHSPKRNPFISVSSSSGRAWYEPVPLTVHLAMILLPKYASLLSLSASVGILERHISFGYFSNTSVGYTNVDLSIDGNGFCSLSNNIFLSS